MIFIFDLLYSIWSSLDPSMQLQRTLFHSTIWLSNIPLYTCTTSSLSILPWNILSEFFSPIYYSIYYPSPPSTAISLLFSVPISKYCSTQATREKPVLEGNLRDWAQSRAPQTCPRRKSKSPLQITTDAQTPEQNESPLDESAGKVPEILVYSRRWVIFFLFWLPG